MAKPKRAVDLPKGMGLGENGSYYLRQRKGGRDRLVDLGGDLTQALMRYYTRKAGVTPAEAVDSAITVAETAKLWLEEYVESNRRQKDRGLARARVNKYLVPRMGKALLGERKLPRQVDSSKLDSRGGSCLGKNVRGGTWPRLSWGRSVL